MLVHKDRSAESTSVILEAPPVFLVMGSPVPCASSHFPLIKVEISDFLIPKHLLTRERTQAGQKN